MTNVRRVNSVAIALLAPLVLSACFLSLNLFERERIWDPAWFGRYEAEGITFVVLPDDPTRRTYLVGSFELGATSVDSYRVALYPGWRDTIIVGSDALGKSDAATVYSLLHLKGADRFLPDWPDCNAEFAKAHNVPRENEVCTFSSLETLRTALKAYADDKAAKPPSESMQGPKALERRRNHPMSTIGVVAKPGVITSSEGVHGALTLLDVPPTSPAAKAGLKRGDVIFGVGNPRPAIGEELLLRIAVAAPGASLDITFFDGKTRAKRQLKVTTAALE